MNNILILDMHNICYGSKFGLQEMIVEPFGDIAAIYGGLRSITKVSQDLKIPWDFVYACFDSAKSYRKEIYPSYKNNRDKADGEKEKFKTQMSYLYTTLNSLGFVSLLFDGFEADDIIAQVCLENADAYKVIVSNDQDLNQLLNKNTIIYKRRGKTYGKYTESDFTTEYRITPNKWVIVKAIAGCRTDTIEGVEKIGETRAIAFIKNELPAKYILKIKENLPMVKANLPLVTLPFSKAHMPIIQKKEFQFSREKMKKVFEIFKFKSNIELMEWSETWTKRH